MGRRQIRSGRLAEIFSVGRARQLNAKVARLCVLYEDLRVETYGIAEPSIAALDVLDSSEDNQFAPERVGSYRRYYFVRRSIGTIREFAEALRLINADPDLPSRVLLANDDIRASWDAAIAFFQTNEALLRAIRNDIGGHFGQEAALKAIEELDPNASGTIELVEGREFRLHFAGEIAASALVPHLEDKDIKGYEVLLRDCIKPAYKHAAQCVQILVMDLWDRFGA